MRAFLRERLGISLRDKTRDFEDAIPIELDGLERWQIADRVLQAQLAGASQASCLEAELARGGLPPGKLADAVLDDITGALDELVVAGASPSDPVSVEFQLDLAGRLGLVGTVAGRARRRRARCHATRGSGRRRACSHGCACSC